MTWTSGRVVPGVVAPPEGAGVDVDGAGPDVEGAGTDVDGDGAPPASCAIAGPAISAVAHNATAVAKAKAGCFMPSPILSALCSSPRENIAQERYRFCSLPSSVRGKRESTNPLGQFGKRDEPAGSGNFSRFQFGTDEVAEAQLNAQYSDYRFTFL